jgi:nucleotide-binding universal stress UspA family protein
MVILVAIDFSETSFTVLKKAFSLAQKHHGILQVIHVIEKTWSDIDQTLPSIQKHSWEQLHHQFPQLHKKAFHCVQGNIIREISEISEKIGAALLVLGSSGENYMFKELLVGSTTKNIVQNSTIPVLVIKNEKELNPTHILIPTNFSEHSRTVIEETASIFKDAQLTLLNIYDVPFEGRLRVYGFNDEDVINYNMQILSNEEMNGEVFFRSIDLPAERLELVKRKGPLSPTLFLEESKSHTADMISLHTTGSFSFFALDVLEESDQDVLIFKF